MSASSLRGRSATVALALVFVLPVGAAFAASASATSVPDVPAVSSLLGNVTGRSVSTADVLDTVTGLVRGGTADGALDGGALAPVAGLTGTVNQVVPLGSPTDALLPRVGDTVGHVNTKLLQPTAKVVDKTLGVATTTVDRVTGLVPHLTEDVAIGTKTATKPAKSTITTTTVANSNLPHTGGDSTATALLLCAGVGVAAAGVALVSRRRGLGALAG